MDRAQPCAAQSLRLLIDGGKLQLDDRLDAELLLRQAQIELFDHETQRQAETDPLFWTGIASQAMVYLLVRDDRPLAERLAAAAARAEQVPRLAAQARAALERGGPARVAAEPTAIAARQARASATFYRESLPAAAGGSASDAAGVRAIPTRSGTRLAAAGAAASDALGELAGFLDELSARAGAEPRLGERYEERFRIVVGGNETAAQVLARAESALASKRAEVAELGRRIWGDHLEGSPPTTTRMWRGRSSAESQRTTPRPSRSSWPTTSRWSSRRWRSPWRTKWPRRSAS